MSLSPEAAAFWAALKAAPKQIGLPLAQRRAAGEAAETATSEPAGVRYDGRANGLWARAEGGSDGTAIVYFFGGGYVLGSPASRRKTAGHLALAAAADVLVPAYRLAPEATFPAPVEDGLAAIRSLLAEGRRPSDIVLAGDSSGGGLAVAVALAALDAGMPPLAGVVSLSPWADLTCSGGSMGSRMAVDLEVTREGLLEMAGWYLKGQEPRARLASPALADLAGLPPLLVIVGSDEVLLDDAVALVRGAGEAGGSARLDIVAGMQHVFPIWAGAFPEADQAIATVGQWVRAQVRPAPPRR